jgi:DNA polymerase III epsilon subunit-like protein
MKHHDFLSSQLADPRPDFIVNFINDMLIKHQKGVYVAYNKSFEQTVLKYLAYQFPKYAKPLIYIAANTIDLMDFFKGKSSLDRAKIRP